MDGTRASVEAIYTQSPFEQHCKIPETLGCELTTEGYITTDAAQRLPSPESLPVATIQQKHVRLPML